MCQGTLLFGACGIDPTSIGEFFSTFNINCQKYIWLETMENNIETMADSKAVILCFWNNAYNIKAGAHYIMVYKKDGNLYSYNNSDNDGPFFKLKEFFSNGRLIEGWIIG